MKTISIGKFRGLQQISSSRGTFTALALDHRQNLRKANPEFFDNAKLSSFKLDVVANLAMALSDQGKKVLIVDADLGVGNLDVLLGLSPQYNLNHVLSGECGLAEIIVEVNQNIKLIPAGSGVQEYTSLGQHENSSCLMSWTCLRKPLM